MHIEIVNSSKKKVLFHCLGIRNCIILWYRDLLSRWKKFLCGNWKMYRISRIMITLIRTLSCQNCCWSSWPNSTYCTQSQVKNEFMGFSSKKTVFETSLNEARISWANQEFQIKKHLPVIRRNLAKFHLDCNKCCELIASKRMFTIHYLLKPLILFLLTLQNKA